MKPSVQALGSGRDRQQDSTNFFDIGTPKLLPSRTGPITEASRPTGFARPDENAKPTPETRSATALDGQRGSKWQVRGCQCSRFRWLHLISRRLNLGKTCLHTTRFFKSKLPHSAHSMGRSGRDSRLGENAKFIATSWLTMRQASKHAARRFTIWLVCWLTSEKVRFLLDWTRRAHSSLLNEKREQQVVTCLDLFFGEGLIAPECLRVFTQALSCRAGVMYRAIV